MDLEEAIGSWRKRTGRMMLQIEQIKKGPRYNRGRSQKNSAGSDGRNHLSSEEEARTDERRSLNPTSRKPQGFRGRRSAEVEYPRIRINLPVKWIPDREKQ
jgi:hypothetical protein